MGESIAKNTAWMTAASIAQKIVSFAYFTLIARSIGPENTGKYFFTLSFTTIFVVFVDLGFTNVFIREVARAKGRLQSLFSTVLGAKLLFGIVSYASLLVMVHILGYPPEIKALVMLSGVTMLFDSLHLTLYGVLRAHGDLRYEAASIPLSQLVSMILGSIFLFLHLPLLFLILAFTIPSIGNASFALWTVLRKYHLKIIPTWQYDDFLTFARIAFPFALAAIFARLYSFGDSIILSKLAGNTAVGWYSIAYKITFAFQFIPLALTAALYPKLSEYFMESRDRLAYTFERSIKYLLLISMPIAVGIAVLARPIVLAIYQTKYLPAVVPLQILIISLIFSFASFPIGAMLNACNRQATQTTIVAGVLATNVLLNLALIPRLGVTGAAIAALVGNCLLAIIGYWIVPTITTISHRFIGKTIAQVGVSALLMGICVWSASQVMHFAPTIIFGAVIYVVFLFGTRAMSRTELREMFKLLHR